MPKSKLASVKGRLFSDQHDQFLGAWFELQLFGWLESIGKAEFEPEVKGNFPDATLETQGGLLVFEAHVVSNSPETIKREKLLSQIFFLLRQINKPYLIVIKGNTLKTISDEDELIGSISDWLELGGNPVFDYGDNKVGHLVLEAKKMPGFSNVEILSSSEFSFVNPKIFRGPLKQKSKQHKILRKQEFPYIIALFIEPFLFSQKR